MKKDTQFIEDEANQFAMCLLMPADMVMDEFRKLKIDLGGNDLIKTLAKKFEVPENAMAIRLTQLKLT